MITFENTIDIDRQPDDVYECLADLGHTPAWNWAITSSEKITAGPVAIGTRYRRGRSVPRQGVEKARDSSSVIVFGEAPSAAYAPTSRSTRGCDDESE